MRETTCLLALSLLAVLCPSGCILSDDFVDVEAMTPDGGGGTGGSGGTTTEGGAGDGAMAEGGIGCLDGATCTASSVGSGSPRFVVVTKNTPLVALDEPNPDGGGPGASLRLLDGAVPKVDLSGTSGTYVKPAELTGTTRALDGRSGLFAWIAGDQLMGGSVPGFKGGQVAAGRTVALIGPSASAPNSSYFYSVLAEGKVDATPSLNPVASRTIAQSITEDGGAVPSLVQAFRPTEPANSVLVVLASDNTLLTITDDGYCFACQKTVASLPESIGALAASDATLGLFIATGAKIRRAYGLTELASGGSVLGEAKGGAAVRAIAPTAGLLYWLQDAPDGSGTRWLVRAPNGLFQPASAQVVATGLDADASSVAVADSPTVVYVALPKAGRLLVLSDLPPFM